MTTSEVAHWRYRNSSNNDLSYWGLDYPPLSGYQVTDTLSPSLNLWNHITQSWLHGKAIQHFQPETVELHTSRGYETQHSKLLMRWSVVISDLICESLNRTDVRPTKDVSFQCLCLQLCGQLMSCLRNLLGFCSCSHVSCSLTTAISSTTASVWD